MASSSRSRPLKVRRLADNVIELSSGESDNDESDSESVSATSSEYATAEDSTNYDGSDEEGFVQRMFQTLTIETSPTVYGASNYLS